MEIENNDQRLVDLFIEDEKARIKQAVSQSVCDRRVPGKNKKAERRRFLQTKNYQRALSEALSKNKNWQLIHQKDPLSNDILLKRFEKRLPLLKQKLREIEEQERIRKKKEEVLKSLSSYNYENAIEECFPKVIQNVRSDIKRYLNTEEVRFYILPYQRREKHYLSEEPLTVWNWERLFQDCYMEDGSVISILALHELGRFHDIDFLGRLKIRMLQKEPFHSLISDPDGCTTVTDALSDEISYWLDEHDTQCNKFASLLIFTRQEVSELLRENTHCQDIAEAIARKERMDAAITDSILKRIPERYPDLYPLARSIKRSFTIHSGPTNSGKTYSSIQKLEQSESGVYLGPLRLLAFEQYERLNQDGIWCSLITGDEKIEIPGAMHEACTIEVANFTKEYETAVIDEAQMLGDPWRGGSWTAAILGICAKQVEVCCAPYAVPLIIKLIEQCGDTYTIVEHERKTPLIVERGTFNFPDDVRTGDALIVFSKRSVHAVASELQQAGRKVSVVYGSLPYNVRRKEAEKFSDKETEIVVATDAIGMGINLPIRRVVFLELEKFDGKERRPLTGEEIRQIAGRAGRMGRFPEGYVTSSWERGIIREAFHTKQEDLDLAVMPFPKSLIHIEGSLSRIMEKWNGMPLQEGFRKQDLSEEIELCKWCEERTSDKDLIFDMVMIPFDEHNDTILSMWKEIFCKEAKGETYQIEQIPSVYNGITLEDLELGHKICDLLWAYDERFLEGRYADEILKAKTEISNKITEILGKQKLTGKTCKVCGRKLPYSFKYTICESCHSHSF